ncbi:MAG: pilus assembly protein PilM [Synergistaceae bacterium]|nr:pilus assembly protein PilM [Synergistaceae bacterium]
MAKTKKGAFAGLALHEDSLRYIELAHEGAGFKVLRQELIPLPQGCISRESIQQIDMLERAFSDLRGQLGKMTKPVVLGVPSRDVTLRLVDYPRMDMRDIQDALSLEFENFFPYPWAEAASSLAEVEVPPGGQGGDLNTTILVATSRLSYINDLLRMASRAGLHPAAIEPMNVAFFRAAVGMAARGDAYFVVGVEPDVTNITLGYRDNGILFRSTLVDLRAAGADMEQAYMTIVRDVQNTMVFAGNQYRGLVVSHLVLGGDVSGDPQLKSYLESGAGLTVTFADPWAAWQIRSDMGSAPGYDAAIGLALRDMI